MWSHSFGHYPRFMTISRVSIHLFYRPPCGWGIQTSLKLEPANSTYASISLFNVPTIPGSFAIILTILVHCTITFAMCNWLFASSQTNFRAEVVCTYSSGKLTVLATSVPVIYQLSSHPFRFASRSLLTSQKWSKNQDSTFAEKFLLRTALRCFFYLKHFADLNGRLPPMSGTHSNAWLCPTFSSVRRIFERGWGQETKSKTKSVFLPKLRLKPKKKVFTQI